jgi:serine/threonine-protein kinase
MDEPDDEPTTIRPFVMPETTQRDAVLSKLRNQIGKYEIREKLGRGSFGVVYLARDPGLERDIAIKVLRPKHLTNPDIVHRFLQEARATARIAHPGIVTIYDCGLVETVQGQTAFIAMELLTGESLTRRLERCGRLEPQVAIEIARQVASALEAAHRAQVLHRDLKPDNIYLVPDPAMPSGERVKILDFGLAKLGNDGHTHVHNVFGTPRYMSPEQCRSSTLVDHRSDVYALGCILFELIAGQPPFDGDVRQVIDLQRRGNPPRALTLSSNCPPALDELIAEMLAKDPTARPTCMAAVQRGLASASAGGDATAVSPPLDVQTPVPGVLTPRLLLDAAVPALLMEQPDPRSCALSGEILVPPQDAHIAALRPPMPPQDGHVPRLQPPRPERAATVSVGRRRNLRATLGADVRHLRQLGRNLRGTLGAHVRHLRHLERVQVAKLAALGAAVFAVVIVAMIVLV